MNIARHPLDSAGLQLDVMPSDLNLFRIMTFRALPFVQGRGTHAHVVAKINTSGATDVDCSNPLPNYDHRHPSLWRYTKP